MDSSTNPRARIGMWIVLAACIGAGAMWLVLARYPALRPSKTPERTAMPAVSLSSASPVADTQDTEVTIPREDLDRLQLKFAKVTEASIGVEVHVPGTVQPNAYKQVHVTSLVGGVVTQVTSELGQPVKRGQALAQIFSRDLAEAQTAYLSANAELEAEHKKLVRTQELVRIGAASRQELEEIEANHQVHAAHVEEARQKLLLLGLDDRQVSDVAAGKQASANVSILAPLDGVVTTRNVNSGQVVTASQDLLTITDLSSVWIEANLLENDFGVVRVGAQATITTPAYPARRYHGVVSYIDPQVDSQTRTAKVRVEINNPDGSLRFGMYMDVLFASPVGGAVPVAPQRAIQTIGSASVVFLPAPGDPGRFLQRTIKLGQQTPTGFQVAIGLKSGETVVTDGSVLLRAEAIRQHP